MSNLTLNDINKRIFNYIRLCLRINGADIYDIKERDYTTIWEVDLNTDEARLLGNDNDNESEFDKEPTLTAFIRMANFVNERIDVWNSIIEYEDGDIEKTYKVLIVHYAYYWVVDMGYDGFKRECKKRFI